MVNLTYFLVSSFLLSLICCQSNAAPKSDSTKPRVHNLAPQFLTYWDQAKSLPTKKQVGLFNKEVVPTFREFYEFKFEKWKAKGKKPEQELARILSDFPKTENKFREKTNQISDEIDRSLEQFIKLFPDLKTTFDLYIIQSLGEMDAGTRRFAGKRYFMFGIDGMVNYHNFKNEVPFFHHELFHQYHDQKLEGSDHGDQLYFALWGEGLATYVSQVLNPQSSMAELMLDLPEGLIAKCDAKLSFLAKDFISKLESASEKDYETYFLLSSTSKDVPVRAGYYLGYLVHKELSRKFSLVELASMKDPNIIKKNVTEVLSKISSGYSIGTSFQGEGS